MQFTNDNLALLVDALEAAVKHCRSEVGHSMGSDNYAYIDQCEDDIIRYQRLLDRILKRHPHLKGSDS